MDLHEIIQQTISENLTHKYYKYVTDLSDKYVAFITNKQNEDGTYPLDNYLRRFIRREDEDLFEQRKNITKHYTPSICAQIMRPFTKVVRSNRVVKLIDAKDASTVTSIEEAVNKFYGQSDSDGVDQFLTERFLPLTFTDPNAWVWVAFNNFNENVEKPQTFPVEYSSKAVVNYKVVNDKTLWVIVKLVYSYQNKDGATKEADRYIIYGDNEALEYKLIPEDIKETFVKDDTSIWLNPTDNKTKYAVYTYEHNSGKVPLMRIGYRKDMDTKSQTYVNPFHYEAMPLLEQFVKVSSEMQLGITLHVFPKQVSYVDHCDEKGCNNGALADGSTCGTCEGTGKKVHTTAADIVEVKMPKKIEDMIDVSKISAYVPFPGGVMDFLDKYVDKLEKKIIRMVFNSESLVQTQFNTATEAEIDVDSIYDTLHPFADKYSEFWMFIVKLTALYMSYENVTIWHKYPSDFKLKPLSQLLTELKTANESNAPSYIRESINNDIADIIYADDQEERSKLSIKNKHFPFSGKTDFEIQNIILNNLTTQYNQVLYANFDLIFDEIEEENNKFYSLTYAKQKDLISEKVNNIIGQIGGGAPVINLNAS